MMEIIVASDMEREELFAEIYAGEQQWAEVIYNPREGRFQVELFPPKTSGSYVFDLCEMQTALEDAKQRLITLGYSEGQGLPSP